MPLLITGGDENHGTLPYPSRVWSPDTENYFQGASKSILRPQRTGKPNPPDPAWNNWCTKQPRRSSMSPYHCPYPGVGKDRTWCWRIFFFLHGVPKASITGLDDTCVVLYPAAASLLPTDMKKDLLLDIAYPCNTLNPCANWDILDYFKIIG